MPGLRYLNPRMSLEDCRKIDKMKSDGRDELLAELDDSFEKLKKTCGETEALRFKVQMTTTILLLTL